MSRHEPVPLKPLRPLGPAAPEFGWERFSAIAHELPPLFIEHWRELALHKDVFTCAPDFERYYALDLAGALRILTVRQYGLLVGYLFVIYGTHPHSKNLPVARVDTYWLDPIHRQGWTGVRMFKELLRQSKEWGSLFVVASIECHFMEARVGKMLERLGFTQTEVVYSRKL